MWPNVWELNSQLMLLKFIFEYLNRPQNSNVYPGNDDFKMIKNARISSKSFLPQTFQCELRSAFLYNLITKCRPGMDI